jgi:hypothetical protein
MFEEGGTQPGVNGQVLIALLVFFLVFFLMVVLGAWVAGKGLLTQEEEPRSAGPAHAASAFDDLTTLEGIGPKVVKVLASQGITSFAALASADPARLKTALGAAGYKYMDPAGWIEQAALAAKGDQAGLKKLQASLKGGRKLA